MDQTMMQRSATQRPALRQAGGTLAGWLIGGTAALFFLADGLTGLLAPARLAGAMAATGYTAASLPLIGSIAIVGAILSLIPRTALSGAIALTGFIGGAVAAHVRLTTALVPEEIVLAIAGLAVWGGLWLREPRLRALLPLSS